MEVKFLTLTLKNVKSHQNLLVNFGEVTKITGDNGQGKSTVPESISWLIYGTDVLGNKIDPSPITYEATETMVSLLLEIDGKNLLLGRGLKKGKATYYINEVPSKAKEFEEIRDKLFDKDLFMSLFNPSYFPSLHWERQRELLLRFVSSPAKKDVLKALPEAQAEVLDSNLKKHNIDDLEKIHKDNKKRKDKDYIAAQSRAKTLQEQLSQVREPTDDIDSLRTEELALRQQIAEADELPSKAWKNNNKISQMKHEINFLVEQRDQMKAQYQALKNEPIEDLCTTCGQQLNGESKAQAEIFKQKRLQDFKKQYDEIVSKRKDLEEEFSQLEYIDDAEQRQIVRDLEDKMEVVHNSIREHEQYERLSIQVKDAQADESATLQDLNNSIFIIDSIKVYRSKEAELQGEKVQALFETLSIRLFDEQKNGEIKPTFEIEMDKKGYRKLSLSESIRAGLELRDVLSKQSELIVPCFVDNCESITRFKQPVGQLIMCKVIADQELKIESESESNDTEKIVVDIEVID